MRLMKQNIQKTSLPKSIHLQLYPCYLLLWLIVLVTMICCWIILNLPASIMIKISSIIVVVVSSFYYILRDALKTLPWSWQNLSVNSSGQMQLLNKRGEQLNASIVENSFVHGFLTIVNIKTSAAFLLQPPIIFINDNRDALRSLRVWLRWFNQNKLAQDLNTVQEPDA